MRSGQIERYTPVDKSELNRLDFLNLMDGNTYTLSYIESLGRVSDDIKHMYVSSLDWISQEPIHVGEGATRYRFLKFASWKLGEDRKFVLEGSLKYRKITDNPSITDYSQGELLELDGGTSQFASAAALMGDKERIRDPPFKLKVTYDCIDSWRRNKKKFPGKDMTLLRQYRAFNDMMDGKGASFAPLQAEDYCFARAFGMMTPEEGEKKWPQLRNHESDRISGMEAGLDSLMSGKPILSADHRVVQALAMLAKLKGVYADIRFEDAVDKSNPEFWNFLYDV